MTRPKIRFAILIPLFLGLAGCATAPDELEPYREVSCFAQAKVSLRDAIEAAETEGGRAIDAAYRQVREFGCLDRDAGYYDVTVLIAGKLSMVSVDAASEQIRPRYSEITGRGWAGELYERIVEGSVASRAAAAERITMHLHDAIAIAEQSGGKAMKAHAEVRNGRAGYDIKLVDRGRVRSAWVDAS